MTIYPLNDPRFERYGRVIDSCDFNELLITLRETTEKPGDKVIYEPGAPQLERTEAAKWLSQSVYGGMPVQVGYCNGHNRALNCLEYHRGSEVNIAADSVVLLLAPLQKVEDGHLSANAVEGFLVPSGVAVLLYETTLHYAPCTADGGDGFRVVIVLPSETNTPLDLRLKTSFEDNLLWARNKWLIAHPTSPEAAQGAFVGLDGDNIILQ